MTEINSIGWKEHEQRKFNDDSSLRVSDSSLQLIQEEIRDLTSGIYELAERMACIASAKGIAADFRVTPLSTPNMSALTTVNQFGGMSAVDVPADIMNISAQDSNINNIV